jgi:hypothetical protein|tara:strand:+ start:342 stop:536 length:195 start_codon:yes stop_codon:yes gene_type:complete
MGRLTTPLLERKIKKLENYLGPRVNYTSDVWPTNQVDRWLMEYLICLKEKYYGRLKLKNQRRLK